MPRHAPFGSLTRGTTHPNRLRRVDRWIALQHGRRLAAIPAALVADLGFGASPVTTLELARRLRSLAPAATVVGIEIDQARVSAAEAMSGPGTLFLRGGFELPAPGRSVEGAAGAPPPAPGYDLVRVSNVLRQYPPEEVARAWHRMAGRLAPGGVIVDGTCDELGRLGSWIAVDADGPRSLTVSLSLKHLAGSPSAVAARLPKALIHDNVPGERVHTFLAALDQAWERAAGYASFGPRHRFTEAVTILKNDGWPVLDRARRWRSGELTVSWEAVAPRRHLW